ncbi:MAG: flagellar export chaperone FlgN [Planctomycetaceae bacterium]|nr:flagellar export chaperone FlgN [Planctomycetaceae bacterium]
MKDLILNFLTELTAAQEKAADVLQRKQKILVKPEKSEVDAIAAEEKIVLESLANILTQRETILAQGKEQGIAADSIKELCEKLLPAHLECQRLINLAGQQSRNLRYLALANYTVSQRSLIHLNQVLEIIETKGQGHTTYSNQNENALPSKPSAGGSFVDKVA